MIWPAPSIVAAQEGSPPSRHGHHTKIIRVSRLSEEDPGPFAYPWDGYAFEAWGDLDADLGVLAAALTKHARSELAHRSVHPHPDDGQHEGWMCTEEVRGRFAVDGHGGPHAVVIDGHRLSWAELGDALESEEGRSFRLFLEDSLLDFSTQPENTGPGSP